MKQRSADLKVHPDETENCADIYVASMATAGLVTVDGEQINHLPSSDVFEYQNNNTLSRFVSSAAEPIIDGASESDTDSGADASVSGGSSEFVSQGDMPMPSTGIVKPAPRAVFSVNITLDSSMDTEKLQKQLEVLRRYGAL